MDDTIPRFLKPSVFSKFISFMVMKKKSLMTDYAAYDKQFINYITEQIYGKRYSIMGALNGWQLQTASRLGLDWSNPPENIDVQR